ncbi:hypothetical protein MHM84_01260 [Halomonas sp. McH1-25]|uniref:hypothetical protein n=1 Tax=unclassified Halomonas TaxID=2609666 RepID=UPI001EF48CCE|nr:MULTISPECIES: hypothetical protein [unclassified Halomonas]MCG7598410.1 hypothetical protein [Halomonas sp. McH1-25]MCP1342648.1 hypothetical protein [Halomonas sp. FL8]MCP1361725.1 hypothetical protein [Halomonas sp. BBD45]MCP1365846.1 hypothetical protein [Halomonas sp. BBD48]
MTSYLRKSFFIPLVVIVLLLLALIYFAIPLVNDGEEQSINKLNTISAFTAAIVTIVAVAIGVLQLESLRKSKIESCISSLLSATYDMEVPARYWIIIADRDLASATEIMRYADLTFSEQTKLFETAMRDIKYLQRTLGGDNVRYQLSIILQFTEAYSLAIRYINMYTGKPIPPSSNVNLKYKRLCLRMERMRRESYLPLNEIDNTSSLGIMRCRLKMIEQWAMRRVII